MDGSLAQLGHWVQNRPFALALAGSDWIYPFVQATHFAGLSLWIGTSAVIDISLLGWGRKSSAPTQLSNTLFLWNWIGFGVAVAGGFFLFSVSAETYLTNAAFLTKVGLLLPSALVLHILVQKNAPAWEQQAEMPLIAKIAGFSELLLWLSVATAAVLIPYVK